MCVPSQQPDKLVAAIFAVQPTDAAPWVMAHSHLYCMCGTQPNKAAPWVLAHSWLYYICVVPSQIKQCHVCWLIASCMLYHNGCYSSHFYCISCRCVHLVRCLLSSCTSISLLLNSFSSLRITACKNEHTQSTQWYSWWTGLALYAKCSTEWG